jgi:ribonuclease Z
VRGKFLPNVAKELGIKPGPAFRELSLGKPVTAASGRIVQPSEVMTAARPGTGFAMCDLPDISYLANFIAQSHWVDREMVQQRTGCFFWILGPGVVSDPRFRDFVASLPNSKHVIASPDVCPDKIIFQRAARANTLLNYLDPVFYPKLYSSSTPPDDLMPEGAFRAMAGMKWQIEPSWEMKLDTVIEPYNPEAVLNEPNNSEFINSAKDAHTNLAQFQPEVCPGSDIEFFTLGTGSALPSPFRNVSATLFRIPGVGSILFDCGENTLGQMKRVFGPEKLKEVLKDLKAVYISHLHADHHLGSVAVLKERSQLIDDDEETFIFGPYPFKFWLKEYSMVERFGHNRFSFICNNNLLRGNDRGNTKEYDISFFCYSFLLTSP